MQDKLYFDFGGERAVAIGRYVQRLDQLSGRPPPYLVYPKAQPTRTW